jgi:hypothetical protein
MDPMETLSTDKTTFESELDLLLSAPSLSDSSKTTISPPPRKRSGEESNAPVKRIKTESLGKKGAAENNDIFNVPPSRRQLLNLPSDHEGNNVASHPHEGKGGSRGTAYRDITSTKSARSGAVPLDRNWSTAQTRTWPTLRNSVRRQWDTSKDDLKYETLVQQRRKEKLTNVDRYVPVVSSRPSNAPRRRTVFPLERIPEDIRTRIFEYLLVSSQAISIDFYWLRSFIRGHARVPSVMQSAEVNGFTVVIPVGWNKLLADVQTMHDEMAQFKKALEVREAKTRATRSPCRGLSTSLLRVSRKCSPAPHRAALCKSFEIIANIIVALGKIHQTATQVFYSKNTFRFPCATSAWIQLDSFLVTIGVQNAGKTQHLQIHPPMWHRLIQEDFIEGAMIDSISPATRMGVIKPPARDRLVSAIQNAVHLLSPSLRTLVLELQNDIQADYWSGRYVNDKRMVAASEAEEHVYRKAKGVALLKGLSEALAANNNRPTLRVCRQPKSSNGAKEFQKQIPAMMVEAKKYGWQVDTLLRPVGGH